MGNKNILTRSLAVSGVVLTWLPLIAPLLLAIFSLLADGLFRFDYLMPAELFFVGLAGGLLLSWGAWRVRQHLALIAGSLVAAVLLLVAAMLLAQVTGLADGSVQMGGWQSALTLGGLVLYILAMLSCAVGGSLLVRDVFRPA
jgi:hypothetical protein